jgi:hypothetical protein
MTEHAERNAAQLVTLTEAVTTRMAADAADFEARRPILAAERMAATAELANLYRHESARVKADPSLIAGASEATRARLKQATVHFEAVLSRHARALEAARTVTEGVVRAIAEEVARTRSSGAGYGPEAQAQAGKATAITLNRRA